MEAKFFTIIILEIGNSLLKSKTIFQIFCNSNHITMFASASFIVSLHLPLQLISAYLFLWNFTIQCSSMITLCWFWRIWISICDDYVIINFSSYFTSSSFFFGYLFGVCLSFIFLFCQFKKHSYLSFFVEIQIRWVFPVKY